MNPTERAAHPSAAQVQDLLNFLEKNPSLAKGFPKVPSAREKARKTWEKLALQLNSLRGCVKTWKQWTKYWADKKSAVKKKGALRCQTQNKTGGGNEVVELSEIEERILALMGGETFPTGDRHLEINPFFEAQAGSRNSPSSAVDPLANIQLTDHNPNPVPSLLREQQSTTSYDEDLLNENVPVVEVSVSSLPMVQSLPGIPPTAGGPASPPIPSGSGRHPQHRLRNIRRRLIGSPQTNTTAARPRRSRRTRARPPSQQRSRLTSILERFLAMEEQRLEINRRNSELFETLVNQTMQIIGEGFKLLTETLKK